MKLLFVALALVVCVYAEIPTSEYLPPVEGAYDGIGAAGEYSGAYEQGSLAQDGYRYKTVRRHRHRRDVNELPTNEYLPPFAAEGAATGDQGFIGGAYDQQGALAQDGYRYKTVRRHRHRRDVNELPTNEYLPPFAAEGAATGDQGFIGGAFDQQGALAQDGYRYKTVRRHRHRRDVNELASNEYLPPKTSSPVAISAPVATQSYSAAPAFAAQESYGAPAGFADQSAYGAPAGFADQSAYGAPAFAGFESYGAPGLAARGGFAQESYAAPAEEVVAEAEPAHTLAEDGYRYKTIRKYKTRRH